MQAYEEYQQGMDIEEVVGKIADSYIEHIEPREEYRFNFDLQEVKNYEVVKDFIYPKVSNLQSNVNRINRIFPTRKKKIWQLPIISGRMEMRNPWVRLQSIMNLMEMYGIDMDTLHEAGNE